MKKQLIISLLCAFISLQLFAQDNSGNLFYTPNYKLKFFGRISADGTMFWGNDTRNVANGTTISQLAFGGIFSFGSRLEGKFEIDFSNGSLLLLDNFLTWKFTNELGLRVGNIQESFSMDLLNSFKDLSLMNRAQVVNAFAPGHHIGMQAVFENNQWLLNGGLHFQRSMNVGHKNNYESNYAKGQNEGFSITGRAVWMPQNETKTEGLHLGVAASYRTPKTDVGQDAEPNTVRYSQSESTINKTRFTDTGYITDTDFNWLGGVELAGYNGPFKFQGEYIHNSINRLNKLATENFSGFYMQASCLLLGGKQDYNNSRGAFNTPIVNNKTGDIELAARFDRLDMNGTNIKGGASNQLTLGLNYYINENLKILFNYYYITHDKFADANGTIDTAGKEGSYNAANVRVQLRF